MFARVSTFQGAPEGLDDSLRNVEEQVLPAARRLEGFAGMLALVDRASGKTVGITLWETEEHMRASEEAANRLRAETAEAAGEEIVSVERYEVVLDTREVGGDG
jgi:heme-degrading monooxygenase HmoA